MSVRLHHYRAVTLHSALLALVVSATLATVCSSAALNRPADQVVLTGADVTSLLGIAPGEIVAFRFSGTWEQVPVQVDERDSMTFDRIYNGSSYFGGGIIGEFYTDADTFAGADSNPNLDANDELVFMARDSGGKPSTYSEPAGVLSGSGVQLTISDPLDDSKSYVYLFRRNGALDPGAGEQYVAYSFTLLSGDYKTTYQLNDGPNPEDSVIVTPYYAVHFSDRWIVDETNVLAGAATGVDILDRRTAKFAPNTCGRSEDTFSDGEGAFYVNKSGPVRALRGYVGANSGPITQREHVFYEAREEMRTHLRVHSIPGIMNLIDYSPAATGMTYTNNLNTGGVTIDGTPDSVVQGTLAWEMVAGPQGSIVNVGRLITDTGLVPTSYYLDDTTPADAQCTGDAFAYGTSGLWITQGIPNTDPKLGTANTWQGNQFLYYDAPGLTATDAIQLTAFVENPLSTTSTAWSSADSDGDNVPDVVDAFPARADEWADADGDGMGDNFEQRIIDYDNGDAYAAFTDVMPGDDFDGDSVSNAMEFEIDADPTDGTTQLPLTVGIVGVFATLSLMLVFARRYLRQPSLVRV
ncbi:MAG: hypothetical protein WC655_08450 [Candidatus Hydrogenedentales bacterium]|jgi:hypothetical protein